MRSSGLDGAGGDPRWLAVGPPQQTDVEIILADYAMGHDPETSEQLRHWFSLTQRADRTGQ